MFSVVSRIVDLLSVKRAALGTQDSKNSHVPTINGENHSKDVWLSPKMELAEFDP